ncbi:MAG: hypothetical protein AAF790_05960 [Planctomycetota bacterium]
MDTAVVEENPTDLAESPNAPAAGGPCCQQCGESFATAQTTACPRCGWYASAGVYVEIERDWEAPAAGQPAAPPPSAITAALRMIPAWAWVIAASGVAVLTASVAVRFGITDEAVRSSWSVAQLLIGLCTMLGCHVAVFIVTAMDDPDSGIADVIVKPTSGWRKLLAAMPRKHLLANAFCTAAAAVLGSVVIIGGIPYDQLWQWNIKEPPKKNLLGAIANAAPAGGGEEMGMEEAMGAFAEDAAVKGGGKAGPGNRSQSAAPLKRKKIDALILGYQSDRNSQISTLFIATEVNGRLLYAGRVTPELSLDEGLELLDDLRRFPSPRPTVTAPDEATAWVKPRFTCRVSYDKRVESGRLQGLMWEEMLGEIKLLW